MKQEIKSYFLFAIIFTLIDSIYLKSMSSFFNKQINAIQKTNIKMDYLAAILCYLTLTIGIYYYGIKQKMSYTEIFFLGIFVYGVYEFTNKAILTNWTWSTVALDTLWGGILFTSSVYFYKLKGISNQ